MYVWILVYSQSVVPRKSEQKRKTLNNRPHTLSAPLLISFKIEKFVEQILYMDFILSGQTICQPIPTSQKDNTNNVIEGKPMNKFLLSQIKYKKICIFCYLHYVLA